jgi:predicted enzyme related to lactoylglutathione lyase
MTPKQQQRLSRVVWFEIPALDFDRAIRFYETILDIKLNRQQFGPTEIAVFTYEAPGIGGCLLPVTELQPSTHASVYLNADPSLDAVLARVPAAGGSILQPRTELPPGMGFYARILDTEGNGIGIHAVN